MTDLCIDVEGDWLGGSSDADDATFGSLVVSMNDLFLTQVEDSISRSVRRSIRVPAVRVARWLVTDWWRLRWEPQLEQATTGWRLAHSMAGLGGGFAWPDLRIASDGEFVQVSMAGERRADVAAIRYLRSGTIEVSAADWERAVDQFLDKVEARVSEVVPGDRELAELREELRTERNNVEFATRYRREARAGYGPGEAPDDWAENAERLVRKAGPTSTDELLIEFHDPATAGRAVEELENAKTTVDLSGVARLEYSRDGRPWQRGASAAQAARKSLGIGPGPVTDGSLTQILGERIPLAVDTKEPRLAGAFRARDAGGSAHVVLGATRRSSQRFALARILGMAAQLGDTEQVLALTGAKTSTQKAARSFAQEFLLPWEELNAITDERGIGERAISWIAEYYDVSEMLVQATLVNRGKLHRERLEQFAH